MRLSDEPVVAEAVVAAAASIEYIVVQGWPKAYSAAFATGTWLASPPMTTRNSPFPVDLVAPARQSNRLGRRSPRPVVT